MLKDDVIAYLSQLKPTLQEQGIARIALFGSVARGEETPSSDIDVAIEKRHDYLSHKSAYEYLEQINEIKRLLAQKFHRKSDVFDLDARSQTRQAIESELLYV